MSPTTPVCALAALSLSWGWAVAGTHLKLIFAERERSVDVRLVEERPYLKLKDLARAFDLELRRVDRATIRINGPRGALQLSSGRRLVRGGHTDLLLELPVWQRSRSDWWVPRGFVDNALAGILEYRLIRQSPGAYRAEALARRPVHVEIRNFPDHVSFAFLAPEPVRGNVREFRSHLEVRFDDMLVEPRVSGDRPRRELVRRLEFGEQDRLGAFHLAKGTGFGFFRLTRESGGELVLDVYSLDETELFDRDSAGEESRGAPAAPSAASVGDSGRFPGEIFELVIDPAASEKAGSDNGLSLDLARRVARQLSERGVRVALTRKRDVLVPGPLRSAMANRFGTKAFVGVGVVRSPEPDACSSQTYVFGDPLETEEMARKSPTGLGRWEDGYLRHRFSSWRLALSVQRELNLLHEDGGRPVEAPVAVLEAVLAPSLLIEVRGSPELVADTADRIAEAIARGLEPVLR